MNKKALVVTIIVCASIIIAYIIVFALRQTNTQSTSKESETIPTVAIEPSQTTKTYTDEAGFTFNYPDDATVTPKTVLDAITYADVEVTSPENAGSITIKAVSTQLTTIDAWLKANKISSTSGEITATQFANLNAKQIATDSGKMIVAIDNGVLFTVTMTEPKDKNYWKLVNDTIISTFAFVPVAPPTSTSNTNSSAGPATSEVDTGGGEDVIE